mmetsp:Transcript_98965/g.279601  ORF Transcript_98965/g.279601 Transcript_98965/m.279601 type:complete len:313 (-) Transcript_98965:614-1552(-)
MKRLVARSAEIAWRITTLWRGAIKRCLGALAPVGRLRTLFASRLPRRCAFICCPRLGRILMRAAPRARGRRRFAGASGRNPTFDVHPRVFACGGDAALRLSRWPLRRGVACGRGAILLLKRWPLRRRNGHRIGAGHDGPAADDAPRAAASGDAYPRGRALRFGLAQEASHLQIVGHDASSCGEDVRRRPRLVQPQEGRALPQQRLGRLAFYHQGRIGPPHRLLPLLLLQVHGREVLHDSQAQVKRLPRDRPQFPLREAPQVAARVSHPNGLVAAQVFEKVLVEKREGTHHDAEEVPRVVAHELPHLQGLRRN